MSSQPFSDVTTAVVWPHLIAHAIKPGEPGRNPRGRPRYRLLSDAMAQKLSERPNADSPETHADRIAEKMVQQAIAGDQQSVIILRDSTEGRPAQAIQLDAHVQTESAEERRARLLTIVAAWALPQEEP